MTTTVAATPIALQPVSYIDTPLGSVLGTPVTISSLLYIAGGALVGSLIFSNNRAMGALIGGGIVAGGYYGISHMQW